jgi:hypothetical protein
MANRPVTIGIDEIIALTRRIVKPETPKARIIMRARDYYRFLFEVTSRGQLALRFLCNRCSLVMGECLCATTEWTSSDPMESYSRKPEYVARNWRLETASVLALTDQQIGRFNGQSARRIRRFIAFVQELRA